MTESIDKCCVPYCANGSHNKADIKFYEFPDPPDFTTDPILHKITSRRKKLWIRAVQLPLKDIHEISKKRICSEHFISGISADLWDIANVDWIPNKNMPYKYNRNSNINKSKKKMHESEVDSKFTDDSSSIYSDDIKEYISNAQINVVEPGSKSIRHSRGDYKNENDIHKKDQHWEKKLSVKEPKKNIPAERKTKNIFTASYNRPIKIKIQSNARELVGKNIIYPKQNEAVKEIMKKPIKDWIKDFNCKNSTHDKKNDLIENNNRKANKDSGNNFKIRSDNDQNKFNENYQNVLIKKKEYLKSMTNDSKVNDRPAKYKKITEQLLPKTKNVEPNIKLNKDFLNLLHQQKNTIINAGTKNVIGTGGHDKYTNDSLTPNSVKNSNNLKVKLIPKNDNSIKKSKFEIYDVIKPQPLINNKKIIPRTYILGSNDRLKLNKNNLTINISNNLSVKKTLNNDVNQLNPKISPQHQSLSFNNKSKIHPVQKPINRNLKENVKLKIDKNVVNNKINLNKDSIKKTLILKKTSKLNIGKFSKAIKLSARTNIKNKSSKTEQHLQKNQYYKINKKNNFKGKPIEKNVNENEKIDKKTIFELMQME